MPYQNVTFPVHRYESERIDDKVVAEVFGNGFLHVKHFRSDTEATPLTSYTTIIIDPGDLDRLEIALKEAKRRQRASERRIRRKIEREHARTA